MKRIILTSLSFILTFNSFSQERPPELQKKLDSLWNVWQDETQTDSIRISAYYNYIRKVFLPNNPDTAFVLAHELLSFAKKKNYQRGIGISYRLIGFSFYYKSDNDKALEYYQRTLPIFDGLGDEKEMAGAYNNIGLVYAIKGDYPKAIEHYKRCLDLSIEAGDDKTAAASLNNIGMTYFDQGNFQKALEFYHRSLSVKEKTGNRKGMAYTLNNIGLIFSDQHDYSKALENYQRSLLICEELDDQLGISSLLSNIGRIHYWQKEFDKALDYYQRSLAIDKEIGNLSGMANTLSNIATVYLNMEDYTRSLSYFEQALVLDKKAGDKRSMALRLGSIGQSLQGMERHDEALKFCKQAFELAESVNVNHQTREACKCLYRSYKALGKHSKALVFYEQMVALKDSMFNEENTKKLTQMEMQYEFDKKEAATQAEQEKKDAIAAQELERQKLVRNGFMGGFTVVLLFAGVFFVQRNKIGKEKERSENLLLNILPAEVAEELKEKGESEAKNFDEVSVIFTDFQSFTQTAEKLNAKELVDEINICFKAFDAITEKYGIEKIKTIGDAYMAAGGLNIPRKSEAKDVVKAALEMQAFMLEYKAEKLKTGSATFEMRVGVHTGPVVAGIVGVKKFQYDIWGDTVNTASRMESNGEVGKVNISETTYNYLKDDTDFVFESRGKINAKGKGEIEMHFVSKS